MQKKVCLQVRKALNVDSLSQVIRNKKEADDFMAEVESAFQRAK